MAPGFDGTETSVDAGPFCMADGAAVDGEITS